MNFGRRGAQFVELLQGRFEHFSLARPHDGVLGAELDALDDASAADLEDLNGGAGWTEFEPEDVAMPERGRGHFLLAIVQRDVWVVANFKETQLTHMRPGQPVNVQVDAYPAKRFQGKVIQVSICLPIFFRKYWSNGPITMR